MLSCENSARISGIIHFDNIFFFSVGCLLCPPSFALQNYNKKMTYANKKEKKRLPPARRTEGNSYESILTTGGTRTTAFYVNFQIFDLKNCIFLIFLSIFAIFGCIV